MIGVVAATTTTAALAGQQSSSPSPSSSRAAATLCGASLQQNAGETWEEAVARADAAYGGLQSIRIFYGGLPPAWPGKADVGRPVAVSFKASPTDIVNNTDGTLDTLRTWFATAPTDQEVYWTYYHEPEDNIAAGEFTAEQYRAAWKVLAKAADEAGNPRLHATLILMEWSLQPASGRDWRDYYPGADTIDVLGWDAYSSTKPNPTSYRSPQDMYEQIVNISEQEGLPFAIPETGTGLVEGDDGTARAQWLRDTTAYLTEHGALFAQYFDLDWREHGGPDFRLSDAPSREAWADFCS